MGSLPTPKRAVRIMNISGSPVDRREALSVAAASNEPIDVFVGDWMPELNMPAKAYAVSQDPKAVGYEISFIEALGPAIQTLAAKKQKLVANAGTVATKQLYDRVLAMIKEKGLNMTIAWIEGDLVMEQVTAARERGDDLKHICSGLPLKDWAYEPVFAQCYLGSAAATKALVAGADIVLCGRIADASPIVAAAAWWHGWQPQDYNQLAQSLIAGHLIECSTYVTGGNFTGLKSLDFDHINALGYPIAEIGSEGEVVITKTPGTDGIVTTETCKEQLLYEIQGMYYLNSDVTAVIDKVKFTQLSKERVELSGVTGKPPPGTTKVGITAFGGYTAELHWSLIGLDIAEKVKMAEIQMRHRTGKEQMKKFIEWTLTSYGSVPTNPRNYNSATVDLRLVAQARDKADLSWDRFAKPALEIVMQSWPAATTTPDKRQAEPQLFQEYFPTIIHQPTQYVHFSNPSLDTIEVPPPTKTIEHPYQQPSYPPTNPMDLSSFGPTTPAPLGYVVLGRAGDKGSNCNTGFFVRKEDEWDWLRSLLSMETFIELMAEEYRGQKIDRMEFPSIWAVHFLVHDHLDRGVTANATYDVLGKFLSEFIRTRTVDIPNKFLQRGRI
ncbi:DUF1446-domain-containing protein [Amniculicola lignicola CBS 123094]|uniref:DUF1446-domain-containing protein n=1 Tax=Amniculicola lignicola CBS 123094 TaxID=1392246 RepID=A0A6A5WLF5_9PLEO|nr:DUF1446-domain-containing protein [Amniculicola lignicola CBS 123094]